MDTSMRSTERGPGRNWSAGFASKVLVAHQHRIGAVVIVIVIVIA
jgi:hypothetical protein